MGTPEDPEPHDGSLIKIAQHDPSKVLHVWALLYDRYHRRLVEHIRKAEGTDHATAEDVAGEVFDHLYNAIPKLPTHYSSVWGLLKLRSSERFKNLMIRKGREVSLEGWLDDPEKRDRREALLVACLDVDEVVEQVERNETIEAVRSEVEGLSPQDQIIAMMWPEHTSREIGEVFGNSGSWARQRFRRHIKPQLAWDLGGQGFGGGDPADR